MNLSSSTPSYSLPFVSDSVSLSTPSTVNSQYLSSARTFKEYVHHAFGKRPNSPPSAMPLSAISDLLYELRSKFTSFYMKDEDIAKIQRLSLSFPTLMITLEEFFSLLRDVESWINKRYSTTLQQPPFELHNSSTISTSLVSNGTPPNTRPVKIGYRDDHEYDCDSSFVTPKLDKKDISLLSSKLTKGSTEPHKTLPSNLNGDKNALVEKLLQRAAGEKLSLLERIDRLEAKYAENLKGQETMILNLKASNELIMDELKTSKAIHDSQLNLSKKLEDTLLTLASHQRNVNSNLNFDIKSNTASSTSSLNCFSSPMSHSPEQPQLPLQTGSFSILEPRTRSPPLPNIDPHHELRILSTRHSPQKPETPVADSGPPQKPESSDINEAGFSTPAKHSRRTSDSSSNSPILNDIPHESPIIPISGPELNSSEGDLSDEPFKGYESDSSSNYESESKVVKEALCSNESIQMKDLSPESDRNLLFLPGLNSNGMGSSPIESVYDHQEPTQDIPAAETLDTQPVTKLEDPVEDLATPVLHSEDYKSFFDKLEKWEEISHHIYSMSSIRTPRSCKELLPEKFTSDTIEENRAFSLEEKLNKLLGQKLDFSPKMPSISESLEPDGTKKGERPAVAEASLVNFSDHVSVYPTGSLEDKSSKLKVVDLTLDTCVPTQKVRSTPTDPFFIYIIYGWVLSLIIFTILIELYKEYYPLMTAYPWTPA